MAYGAPLAQSVEHETLDLRVVGSSSLGAALLLRLVSKYSLFGALLCIESLFSNPIWCNYFPLNVSLGRKSKLTSVTILRETCCTRNNLGKALWAKQLHGWCPTQTAGYSIVAEVFFVLYSLKLSGSTSVFLIWHIYKIYTHWPDLITNQISNWNRSQADSFRKYKTKITWQPT